MDFRRAQFEEMLEAYQPFDAEERAHWVSMRELLSTPGDPFGRDHYGPGHYTASSFIVSPDGGALLLIFHGKLERWLQPGGHVEPSDATVLDAARREAREEVGLSDLALLGPGIFDLDVHAIPARGDAPAHHHFDVRFLFRAPSSSVRAASDAQAVRWVKLGEVSAMESDRSVLRAVDKLGKR